MDREELKAAIDELMRQYADEEIDGATYVEKADAARLGLDTELGDSWRFTPIVLDLTLVAAGHLSATWPFDVTDRMVTGRDRLPDGPPL